MRQLALCLVVGLQASACGSGPSSGEAAASTAAPSGSAAAAHASSAAAPSGRPAGSGLPLPPAGAPGPLYLGTRSGIAVLQVDGKFAFVKGSEKLVVAGLKTAADGQVYAVTTDRTGSVLYKVEISGVKRVLSIPETVELGDFDVLKDGRFVATNVYQLVEYKGKGGGTHIVGDARKLCCVGVDPDGTVWAGGENKLYAREGSEWKWWAFPVPDEQLRGFATTAAGWRILTDRSIYEVRDAQLSPAGLPIQLEDGSAGVSPSGVLAVTSWRGVNVALERLHKIRFIASKEASTEIEAVLENPVVDGSGRAWGLQDGELTVVHVSDGHVDRFPMGSIPELDNMESLVSTKNLAVVGAGPALPQRGAVRKAKEIRGTVLLGGKPAASVPVELCPNPGQIWRDLSPCARKPNAFTTLTDAQGKFVVADPPMGTYKFALKDKRIWGVDGALVIDSLREGQVKDLGKLAYLP